MSYFELVGSLVSSETGSRKRFNAGVKEVLPEVLPGTADDDTLLSLLYEGARCGLYHSARPGAPVGLGQPDDGNAIAYDRGRGKAVINPHRLPRVFKAHLLELRTKLMDPVSVDLRQRFQERFDTGFPSR